jgi:hypothetical protein
MQESESETMSKPTYPINPLILNRLWKELFANKLIFL